jgi:8-oxo-dGTP pyrophosphatase MutT (NUDIX family)
MRHFTATVYVFHENQVLLHYHAKLKSYLPPGGHIEANETPVEAARREVMEETGLEIEFIEQENLKVESDKAMSFLRPYLCLLENLPDHQHMDLIYLARPREMKAVKEGFSWFSIEEALNLDLFPDVRQMLLHVNGRLKKTEGSLLEAFR